MSSEADPHCSVHRDAAHIAADQQEQRRTARSRSRTCGMLDQGEKKVHQDRVLPRPRIAIDEPADVEEQVIYIAFARPRLLVYPADGTGLLLSL